MDSDFEDLSHDKDLIARIKQFDKSIDDIDNLINVFNDPELYDKLSNVDKINYNLLMSYSLNSLFWMYLRTAGKDPMKHQIKKENDRLKTYMMRAKQIADKKTLMPHINKNAAKRFIRNSLWEANKKDSNDNSDKKV